MSINSKVPRKSTGGTSEIEYGESATKYFGLEERDLFSRPFNGAFLRQRRWRSDGGHGGTHPHLLVVGVGSPIAVPCMTR
jgi:hypothetical protein